MDSYELWLVIVNWLSHAMEIRKYKSEFDHKNC